MFFSSVSTSFSFSFKPTTSSLSWSFSILEFISILLFHLNDIDRMLQKFLANWGNLGSFFSFDYIRIVGKLVWWIEVICFEVTEVSILKITSFHEFLQQLSLHSVKISGFFCHFDFTWNQFWLVLMVKNCNLNNFGGFDLLGNFILENVEFKNLKFGAAKTVKMAVFDLLK